MEIREVSGSRPPQGGLPPLLQGGFELSWFGREVTMSLYNMLFGYDEQAPYLLKMLGLTPADVPRFRDCYLYDGKIVVYTRTGGGNRDFYESEETCRSNYPEYFTGGDEDQGPWNQDLRENKYYISDRDDHTDSTYAYFYFRYPEEYKELLNSLEDGVNPSEKWNELLKGLR